MNMPTVEASLAEVQENFDARKSLRDKSLELISNSMYGNCFAISNIYKNRSDFVEDKVKYAVNFILLTLIFIILSLFDSSQKIFNTEHNYSL